jgi:hypothetical protein
MYFLKLTPSGVFIIEKKAGSFFEATRKEKKKKSAAQGYIL